MGNKDSPCRQETSASRSIRYKKADANNTKKASVKLPAELVEHAQELGLDVSSYCENALKATVMALERVDPSEYSNSFLNQSDFFAENGLLSHRTQLVSFPKEKTKEDIIEDFCDFCEVDLDLTESTIRRHLVVVRDFLDYFNDLSSLSREKIRGYLKERKRNEAKATYANRIKALRRFLRDFLKKPELIEGFKIPQLKANDTDTNIVDEGDLQTFYRYINLVKYEAILLFKGSSGIRTSEVTNLTVNDVDFEKRMIVPNHDSSTKKSYVTFYNSEAEERLQEFMPRRNKGDNRLFQTNDRTVQKSFRRTSKRAGIKITPKMLRKWFAKEMRNLNVSGEHIDAFCGRVPSSVRGKHYTDFSKERLREVYERADIRILD